MEFQNNKLNNCLGKNNIIFYSNYLININDKELDYLF